MDDQSEQDYDNQDQDGEYNQYDQQDYPDQDNYQQGPDQDQDNYPQQQEYDGQQEDQDEYQAQEYEQGFYQEEKKSESRPKSQGSLYDKEFEPRLWQWATPLIEGVPPCPRGGHSATLSGASIIIFGVKNAVRAHANSPITLELRAKWRPRNSTAPQGRLSPCARSYALQGNSPPKKKEAKRELPTPSRTGTRNSNPARHRGSPPHSPHLPR